MIDLKIITVRYNVLKREITIKLYGNTYEIN